MKALIWDVNEILYRLAKWRAKRHISRTDAMLRIMQDAYERQKRIMEAEE